MEPEEEVVESATDNVFDTKQLVDTLSTTDGLCAEVLEIAGSRSRPIVSPTLSDSLAADSGRTAA